MKHFLTTASIVALALICAPGYAADAPTNFRVASQCLTDLKTFTDQMRHDSSWSQGFDSWGYGYPMSDYPASVTGYHSVRPGHDVRVLVASAAILAREGQQQQCEALLTTTRALYKSYNTEINIGESPSWDQRSWRDQQIAAAHPVTDTDIILRLDDLVGTEVRDPHGEGLGSVSDLVLAPQSGKIAYVVIGRGGLFGFDEKYIAVPWADFKITPARTILVLNTTKTALDTAPWGQKDQFSTQAHFDAQSQKVDAYWKGQLVTSAAH